MSPYQEKGGRAMGDLFNDRPGIGFSNGVNAPPAGDPYAVPKGTFVACTGVEGATRDGGFNGWIDVEPSYGRAFRCEVSRPMSTGT